MPRIAPDREALIGTIAEIFREHGYEGASLSLIGEATGLGKGSLYNFFPDGKKEMAAAVLAHIDGWFEANVFCPLRDAEEPFMRIDAMFDATDSYFQSGRRICLVGAFALDSSRDRFGSEIKSYFARWVSALAGALERCGYESRKAEQLAEETVAGIQGALTLSRAYDDPSVFTRALQRLRDRVHR
jgi:TetR/AcrR family transcriptional regulator, lmrAB and yxaGH operons repressor